MTYQRLNKITEILPLAISNIARLHNQFNHICTANSYGMFKKINFDQTRPKIKLFSKKFLSAGGSAPQPLQISCYHPDAEHPMPLALSDVEPQFQKLLKR